MHAYYQFQLTNPRMARALPLPPVVPAFPAPLISLSRPFPQFGIPTMNQCPPDLPIIQSSIPVYVPPQNSMRYPYVASQFVPVHSHAHPHRTSAPANSNETKEHLGYEYRNALSKYGFKVQWSR